MEIAEIVETMEILGSVTMNGTNTGIQKGPEKNLADKLWRMGIIVVDKDEEGHTRAVEEGRIKGKVIYA